MYNQIWTAHLQTDDEKQRFINQLKGSREILDRLEQMIHEKEKELEATERSMKAYETPNWAFLQAHKNGFHSAIKSIKTLISGPKEQ